MYWNTSKFRKRHLDALQDPNTSYVSPLQVVGHIDLDGFYAQCEQVRLGLSPETPVACRQWDSLIAINYAAKKFDISRHDNVEEAVKKCPHLVLAHVATFKKGEITWTYREHPSMADHKVSLDPFRRESRKIFSLLKKHVSIIEKASIDEAFLDLGSLVYQKAKELFPQLKQLTDPEDCLPATPSDEELANIKWCGIVAGHELEELEATAILDTIDDLDDILLMLGSMIVADIRSDMFQSLKYTCSAGVASNKMLAKLGSTRNKPNQQTVVRVAAVDEFLTQSQIRDLWGFGGKLGDEICKNLRVPDTGSIPYLTQMSLADMEIQLGDAELAQKLYRVVRGTFATRISTRVTVKSMNSVKKFKWPQKTIADCKAWLKVFAADIAARILELEDDLKAPVRPGTIGIHYNLPYKSPKSRQMPFSLTTKQDFESVFECLFEAASRLFDNIYNEGSIVPAAMLSLVIGRIELQSSSDKTLDEFFSASRPKQKPTGTKRSHSDNIFVSDDDEFATEISCSKCHRMINVDKQTEHMDWHVAKEIQKAWSEASSPVRTVTKQMEKPASKKAKDGTPTKRSKGKPPPKNQSILNYFKNP